MGPACPPRFAIDHHCARSTHADSAGEAIAQSRLEIALHPGNDIEDRLAIPGRHPILDITAPGRGSPPNGNVESFCYFGHGALSVLRGIYIGGDFDFNLDQWVEKPAHPDEGERRADMA